MNFCSRNLRKTCGFHKLVFIGFSSITYHDIIRSLLSDTKIDK